MNKSPLSVRFFLTLALLSFITYFPVLGFGFWKDDWVNLWSIIVRGQTVPVYWLHPATAVEFIVFSKLFGLNPFFWHVWGILLRVFFSFSVFHLMWTLTASKKASVLAGIFSGTLFAGADSVGWVSAHVALVVSIFSCLAISFWLRYLMDGYRRHFWLFVIFALLAFISDPWRALPLGIVTIIGIFAVRQTKQRMFAFKFIGFASLVLILFTAVGLYSYWFTIRDAAIVKAIASHHDMVWFVRKISTVGNFFNSIANLFVGWFLPIAEQGSSASYHPLLSYLALAIVLSGFAGGVMSLVNRRVLGKQIFFLVWIVSFYVPAWLFEPRLTVAPSHRYLVLPSVGLIGIVSYFLDSLRSKRLFYIGMSVFIIFNIVGSWIFFDRQSAFRDHKKIESAWTYIESSVSPEEGRKIFVYSGTDPVKTYLLNLSSSLPYAIKRRIDEPDLIPIITEDLATIVSLVCTDTDTHVDFSNIYQWQVDINANIKNLSEQLRYRVKNEALTDNCVLD